MGKWDAAKCDELVDAINLSKKHMPCSVLLVLFGILKKFT